VQFLQRRHHGPGAPTATLFDQADDAVRPTECRLELEDRLYAIGAGTPLATRL